MRNGPQGRPIILDEPFVDLGPEVCGDPGAALRREWLVTNGLGGYAMGTLAGVATRRYHGYLVAALEPPVGRTVLVGGLDEWATHDGARVPLGDHEFAGAPLEPLSIRRLERFRLEGSVPVFTFALGEARLEKRVWMAAGANTTYVTYRLARGRRPVGLEITPLVTERDHHALRGGGWRADAREVERGVEVRPEASATLLRLLVSRGRFEPGGAWWWGFRHRAEAARGLDDRSDLFAPGTFLAQLEPSQTVTLLLSAEPASDADRVADGGATDLDGERALAAELQRQRDLLRRADAERAERTVQQLVLAADAFLVERRGQAAAGRTVIAGYPWFNDWGRDTFISLPGLTLATGLAGEAASILRSFAPFVRDGLLPNNFPDRADDDPGYNTVDASLWYVLAVRAHHEATGDDALVDELLPVVRSILDAHLAGTRFGIGVDPTDGLLRAGEPGLQLTWMDARVGDWVVTPRIGKPVEINALWYNALCSVVPWLQARGDAAAHAYAAAAEQVRASFRRRFWRPDLGHLADVVDGPAGDETRLRPNQILALSLPFPLVEGREAEAVLDAVGRELFTTYGLRSLAPSDFDYRGDYGGDQLQRDSAYHQGPVWTWLLGPYAEAHERILHDRAGALAILRTVEHHLRDAGLGTVSEILEGDPPHRPDGCIAQAWGVAEILRAWRAIERA